MTNIQPLRDYVLLKQLEAEGKTKSGLYLPDSAQEKPSLAEVRAIGPGYKEDKPGEFLKEGDHVLYKKFAGDDVKIDGETFIVIRLDGIIAKVSK